MALSLDDIIAAPTDPDLLNKHLQGLGLLQRPPETPQATIGPLSPVMSARSDVAPMTPPVPVEAGHPKELTGLNRELALGATVQPNMPAHHVEDMNAPEIGGTPSTPEMAGVKPMVPPALSHAEKMALPQTSTGAPIGSAAFTENQLERLQEQKEHPWGTAENHPGALGKIGHVAGKIGNIALDVLAPGIGVNIPGTDLNRMAEQSKLKTELAQRTAAEGQAKNLASEEAARDVTTAEGRARLAKMQTEQSLERDTEGNVTGWKDAQGKLHGLDEEGTPQGVKDIAEATQNKPHFEKSTNGDIVQIIPGKNGAAATSNVVYKGQPGQKLETKQIVGADGHAHDLIVDMNAKDDQGRPGKIVNDLGRSKEDKQPSPTAALQKQKSDEEPVIGYDKNGAMHLMPRAQAKESGLQHIIKASDKDRQDAQNNTSGLNEVGVKTRNLLGSLKALDQGSVQRGIIAFALTHPADTTGDTLLREQALKFASEETKNYVTDVLNLREAVLALPKIMTGGSRINDVQAHALWQTIADGSSADSKYAVKQLQKFDQMTDRLWKKVPHVEGNPQERAFEQKAAGGGGGGSTIKMGGKEIQVNDDGTFDYNGHTYKTTPGSKQATLVK